MTLNEVGTHFSACLTMKGPRYFQVVKALLLIILLIIFFFLFFLHVIIQYSEKYTNTAKIVENAEKVEVPTISFCTGWKESVFKKYKVCVMKNETDSKNGNY